MNLKKAIIHIGGHKTGSTSIQHFLFKYFSEELYFTYKGKDHNFLFISCFSCWNHVSKMKHYKLRYGNEYNFKKSQNSSISFLNNLLKEKNKQLIFSAEVLFNHSINFFFLSNMKNFFEERGYKIEIIGFVRNPISFASSALNQSLKNIIQNKINVPLLKYKQILSPYLLLFPRADLYIFSYDNIVHSLRKDIVNFFLEAIEKMLHLNLNNIYIDNQTDFNVNKRLPLEVIQLNYFIFKRFKQHNLQLLIKRSIRVKLNNDLASYFNSEFEIPITEILSKLDWSDLKWLEEKFAIKFAFPKYTNNSELSLNQIIKKINEHELLKQLEHFMLDKNITIPKVNTLFKSMSNILDSYLNQV